jgi:hypothetical protein
MSPVIAYLTSRVNNPNQDDFKKLVRMMKYLKQTRCEKLTCRANGSKTVKWYIDAEFAANPDSKSYTGGTMTICNGASTSISRKQKVNTENSTEAELVALYDVI